MGAELTGFDLAAAWTRNAGADMRAFTEALAARLEPALPGRVAVERRRDGLFSSTRHVSRIVIRFDDALLTLAIDAGRVEARRAKVVRGVSISGEAVGVPAWLDEVVRRTEVLGEGADAAHTALRDFLMS